MVREPPLCGEPRTLRCGLSLAPKYAGVKPRRGGGQSPPQDAGIEDTPGKGAVHDLRPGHGDLIVMGGRCQADWQHSVPYLTRSKIDTRISLQWRWTSRRGKPFQGGSYGAPLTYSR